MARLHKEVISLSHGGIVERLCRLAFSLPFDGLLILVLLYFPYKVPNNLYPLFTVSAAFVQGMDEKIPKSSYPRKFK